jgi:uncharacterized protein (TIGR02266 family)
MSHPAKQAREHISAGLEACQSDPVLAASLELLAKNLAQAQGKLFPASKLDPASPAAVDLMRRAMEYLAQGLKVLQDVPQGGGAVDAAAKSIALALKTLHPVVREAKETAKKNSTVPPPRSAGRDSDVDAISVNVNTMLNLHSDHQFYNGFSENIEEGGIFIATFDPKPVDAKVIVNFKLPGGIPVTAHGVVQFVREYNPTTPETAPGMGVKFTSLLEKDKKAIEAYLKRRAPMFYDDGR